MVWVEPRSTRIHCGSLKALDQRVPGLPSTARLARVPPFSSEEERAGLLSARLAEVAAVGVALDVGVGTTGVGVAVPVVVGMGVLVGQLAQTVGVGSLMTGLRANLIGLSAPSLAVFTVSQSSFKMPPVSPESGFKDQKVQLLAVAPVP